MTVALIAVVVIAIGLPLLAWWLGGRRFWSRLRPGVEPDPWGDAMRQFGLKPQEAGEVESAVNWGRRLEDPRLQRAAVAWAQQRIDHDPRLRINSRWARMALLGLWVVVVGAALTWMTVSRGSFPWDQLLFWVVWPAVLARIAQGPYRALRLNAEAAPSGDEKSSAIADGDRAQ